MRSLLTPATVVLLLWSALCVLPAASQAREVRRSMAFIRPLLMGNAYVAVGDEDSALFYNPAVIPRLPESSLEALTTQMLADTRLKRVWLDAEATADVYGTFDVTTLQNEIGTSLYALMNIRMPLSVSPKDGQAWALAIEVENYQEVIDLAGLPAIWVESSIDLLLISAYAYQLSPGLTAGLSAKIVGRTGIDKIIDSATLFAAGPTLDFSNDPDFQEFAQGKLYAIPGLDLGLIYQFPGGGDWRPRFGLSVLNIGGYETGQGFRGLEFGTPGKAGAPPLGGTMPLLTSIGFAASPIYNNIRYTMALDVVDVTRTVLVSDSWNLRTRVGLEIGIGPKAQGVARWSFLTGFNAGHFSWGVLSRVAWFEIGMGQYTVERGDVVGELPDERRAMLFGMRF